MNSSLTWLYQQCAGSSPVPSGPARCYLCGASCPPEHSVAKGLADTFNSHYLALCPSSPWLCAACYWYFDGKAAHPDFRKMSLIVAEQSWHNWQRAEMKPHITHWLAHGLDHDAFLVVSLSKKKHILLQAPLNARGTTMLAVQVEEQVAYLDRETWDFLERRFTALLALGHNKGEVLSGNLYGNTLRKHGRLAEALQMSQELEPYRGSALLELLSYVTITDDKKEGNEDDDRSTSGAATDAVSAGIGTEAGGSRVTAGRVERHGPGIQEQVPHGDLETIRGTGSDVRPHYEQPGLFSE